jgi:threonine synthase
MQIMSSELTEIRIQMFERGPPEQQPRNPAQDLTQQPISLVQFLSTKMLQRLARLVASVRSARLLRARIAAATSSVPLTLSSALLPSQSVQARLFATRTLRLHASQPPQRASEGWTDKRPDRANLALIKRNAVKSNIVLMGPPGSGKTSIGRALAQQLDMKLIDIDDDHLEPTWGTSVASKLKELGDDGFVQAEGAALMQLTVTNTIISLSGSNPLHPRSLEHVARDGMIFYLDIAPQEILARCERMKVDRIVGQATHTLASILAYRQSIYENCYDVRLMISHGESPSDLAQRIAAVVQRKRTPAKYVSTRGYAGPDVQALDFLDVVQLGLSPDRGLFIPSCLKGLAFTRGELDRMKSLPYEELALRVLERFPLGDRMPPSELRRVLYEAYSAFGHPDILPLVHLQTKNSKVQGFHANMHLMETFHGPTASFKDLSLQLLPKLLQVALSRKTTASGVPEERVGLLVATSGDTGTAALDGFSRQHGVPVIVLYPSNGVSIVQRAQMQTTGGDVLVLGVDSDFDFCQKLVKDIFNDEPLKREFRRIVPSLLLSSANSMNWGRFLPQIVFSISSYLRLVRHGTVTLGEEAHLVVPTGNFGNILGAVYAKLVLGLPLGKIVCASNSNNILYDFLRTGTYDLRQRSFTQTVSPSIDILVSSNLERFLYLLSDGDSAQIRSLFSQLQSAGHFTVSPELRKRMQEVVQGGWANEKECLETIRKTFEATGEFIGQSGEP